MATGTLESLPTELLVLIIANFRDLKSIYGLIRASPSCHRAYLGVRRETLQRLIQQRYDADQVDISEAIAAVRSEGLYAKLECNREAILILLDYRRRAQEMRKLAKDNFNTEKLTVEECIAVLNLRRKFDFLLHDFCRTVASPANMDPKIWTHERMSVYLSRLERARFLRALHRMQTYSNIFGNWNSNSTGITLPRDDHKFTTDDVWGLFFATMPPWEMEEVGCISAYLREKYVQIFAEIADELSESGPSFKDLLPGDMPFQPREMHPTSFDYDYYLGHFVSLGPKFLCRVLDTEQDEERKWLIQRTAWPYGHPLLGLSGLYNQPYRLISPADGYERSAGDIDGYLSTLPILEQPTFSWIRRWFQGGPPGSRFLVPITRLLPSRMFEERCEEEQYGNFGARRLWKYGYVFWDNQRLTEWSRRRQREG